MIVRMMRGLALVTAVSFAACAPAEDEGAEAEGAAEEAAMAEAAPSLPDTTFEAVWGHLEEAGYAESWALWPERGELYPGGEPHGMLLTTYVNDVAAGALVEPRGSMPVGAIIVKENYMADSTLAAVTVMYKTESFNPEHNNWYFIKRNADGSVDAAGRFDGCQNCHGARADNDYILTSSLAPPAPEE